DEPLVLSQAWRVATAVEGDAGVVLQPDDFFFSLGTELPLGAIVRGKQTIFRLFAPRAGRVRLFVQNVPGDNVQAETVDLDRHPGVPHVWEVALEGNLHGWYYWYQLEGLRDATTH